MTITPSAFSKDALGVELLPENAKALDDAFALGAPSRIQWIGKSRSGLTLKCCIAALWAVDFARQYNLDYSHLSKVAHGKRPTHKGWTGRIVEKLK
jgi:hypothetical protein